MYDTPAAELEATGPHPWTCATCTADGIVDGHDGAGHAIAERVAGLPVVGVPVRGKVVPAETPAELAEEDGAPVWAFSCPVCGAPAVSGGAE